MVLPAKIRMVLLAIRMVLYLLEPSGTPTHMVGQGRSQEAPQGTSVGSRKLKSFYQGRVVTM